MFALIEVIMKKCPYCAGEIQGEALKCRHCGKFFSKGEVMSVSGKMYAFPRAWMGYVLAVVYIVGSIVEFSLIPEGSTREYSVWGLFIGLIGLVIWCRYNYRLHEILVEITGGGGTRSLRPRQ